MNDQYDYNYYNNPNMYENTIISVHCNYLENDTNHSTTIKKEINHTLEKSSNVKI